MATASCTDIEATVRDVCDKLMCPFVASLVVVGIARQQSEDLVTLALLYSLVWICPLMDIAQSLCVHGLQKAAKTAPGESSAAAVESSAAAAASNCSKKVEELCEQTAEMLATLGELTSSRKHFKRLRGRKRNTRVDHLS